MKGLARFVAVVALMAAPAMAQLSIDGDVADSSTLEAPIPHEFYDYPMDSGFMDNTSDSFLLVLEEVVQVPESVSMRLHFSEIDLGTGSFLRVISTRDQDEMTLDGKVVIDWSNTTAYFNGDTLLIQLYAAPHTQGNRFVLEQVEAAKGSPSRGGNGDCGICGTTDDRVPSAVDWSCRLMTVGCTGSVVSTQSCIVSAGHCISGNLVAQFRVPNSNSNCSTVNPPAADQFAVGTRQFVNGGVGNDWSVMRVNDNSLGQQPYERYGSMMPIANAPANTNQTGTLWGYGVDRTCTRSQTQQTASGPINAVNSNHYRFSIDLRGGNSGSGLIVNNQLVGIVTHCPCPNYATRHDLAAFANARLAVCPELGNELTCNDLKTWKGRCKGNGTIIGKAVTFDESFDGQTVTFQLDGGSTITATFNGRRAKGSLCCFGLGSHTIALIEPSCGTKTVVCN